jgi:Ni/Fe-hydrogenase b-type cytochrome subunit
MTVAHETLPATAHAASAETAATEAGHAAAARDAHHIADPERRVRLYIWQVPVRITHWVTAFAIATLSITGAYIADPFIIPPGGPVMSTIRQIHIITALIFLLSGLVRTWMLIFGNRFARWTAFIPTNRRQATELFSQAGFYGFIRRDIPEVLGHNQLAAAAYVVLFGLLLIETVTGFALDGLMGPARPSSAGCGTSSGRRCSA